MTRSHCRIRRNMFKEINIVLAAIALMFAGCQSDNVEKEEKVPSLLVIN